MSRQVFIAFKQDSEAKPEMVRIYSKSSYQKAYDWIADSAEKYGNLLQPFSLKYPTNGTGNVVVETVNPETGQRCWIERHEVE